MLQSQSLRRFSSRSNSIIDTTDITSDNAPGPSASSNNRHNHHNQSKSNQSKSNHSKSKEVTDSAASQLNQAEIPLFPLGTVLFDGGQLPLRIFEPRYIDMISRCMKSDSGFGVVLLRTGSSEVVEKGAQARGVKVFTTGTEARIEDFNPLSDGALGIVARGARKFAVKDTRVQSDGLLLGQVEFLAEEPAVEVEERFESLIEILQELIRHPMIEKMDLAFDFTDARSVGWRLAELLPIEAEIKQSLLQMQLPRERLVELVRIVNKLKG